MPMARSSNSPWYRFRRLVATVKLFASAHYQLLHLIHTAPSYGSCR